MRVGVSAIVLFLAFPAAALAQDAGVPSALEAGTPLAAPPDADAGAGADAGADADADADAGADAGPRPDQDHDQIPDAEDAVPDAGTAAAVDAGADAGPPHALRPPSDWTFEMHGEAEARFDAMSDIPLRALPTEPGTGKLGQNGWAETWLRLRAEGGYRPAQLKLIAQADFLSGVLAGDHAVGIYPSRWRRDRYVGIGGDAACTSELHCNREFSGIGLRQLYLEWQGDFGVLRAGQQTFHWGLGIVANDGEHAPVFGDYRFGHLVERILWAFQPLGRRTPFFVAVAGDLVFDDGLADLRRGDVAWQGVLSAFWQEGEHGERQIGGFAAYRDQTNSGGDWLKVGIFDLFARWDFAEPTGGRAFVAAEAAAIFGQESLTRTLTRPHDDVRQGLAAIQLGRRSEMVDATLELGYTSGDANTEDGVQSRATMDADHRVGLILFPEVMNWMSARAVAYGIAPSIVGRPAPGTQLVPTDGGVAGSIYVFPHLVLRPISWLEIRLGGVLGRTTSDNVDPVEQRLASRTVNYRGGDSRQRDLGVELDAAVLATVGLRDGLKFVGGVEGGLFFPGQAFADASGHVMDDVGLVRLRAGLRW